MVIEIMDVLNSHREEMKDVKQYNLVIFSILEGETSDMIRLEKTIKVIDNVVDYNEVVLFCKDLLYKYENCGYSFMGIEIEAHNANDTIGCNTIKMK